MLHNNKYAKIKTAQKWAVFIMAAVEMLNNQKITVLYIFN